jgi:hypothetical protein
MAAEDSNTFELPPSISQKGVMVAKDMHISKPKLETQDRKGVKAAHPHDA